MFRKNHPVAWSYHRNSYRWQHDPPSAGENAGGTPAFKEFVDLPTVTLPPPLALHQELSEAICGRFSCRRFKSEMVPIESLATLLHWSYGKLGTSHPYDMEIVTRPVPSAGGLYPLELYIMAERVGDLRAGIYHYNVLGHLLERLHDGAMPPQSLSDLFAFQPCISECAFVLVFTCVFERSLWKYKDRGYRYMLFEAGHAAQNANLAATALRLASLDLGGFFDADLASALGVEVEEEAPLYAVAVGWPEGADPGLLRMPRPTDDG